MNNKIYNLQKTNPILFNKIIQLVGAKNIKNIITNDNKIFFLKQNDNLYPLGCELCIDPKIQFTNDGYPQINNKKLISAEDFLKDKNNIQQEIINNLWFCPECNLPILNLIPKFL